MVSNPLLGAWILRFECFGSCPHSTLYLLSPTLVCFTGGLNLDEDEDITGAKRRRIASNDSVVATSKQIVGRGQVVTTPVKLTLNKNTPATSANPASQKVSIQGSSDPNTLFQPGPHCSALQCTSRTCQFKLMALRTHSLKNLDY